MLQRLRKNCPVITEAITEPLRKSLAGLHMGVPIVSDVICLAACEDLAPAMICVISPMISSLSLFLHSLLQISTMITTYASDKWVTT